MLLLMMMMMMMMEAAVKNGKCEWISLIMVSTIVFAAVPLIIYFQVFCVLYSPKLMCSVKYTTAPQMSCTFSSGTFLQFLIPLLEITL